MTDPTGDTNSGIPGVELPALAGWMDGRGPGVRAVDRHPHVGRGHPEHHVAIHLRHKGIRLAPWSTASACEDRRQPASRNAAADRTLRHSSSACSARGRLPRRIGARRIGILPDGAGRADSADTPAPASSHRAPPARTRRAAGRASAAGPPVVRHRGSPEMFVCRRWRFRGPHRSRCVPRCRPDSGRVSRERCPRRGSTRRSRPGPPPIACLSCAAHFRCRRSDIRSGDSRRHHVEAGQPS